MVKGYRSDQRVGASNEAEERKDLEIPSAKLDLQMGRRPGLAFVIKIHREGPWTYVNVRSKSRVASRVIT